MHLSLWLKETLHHPAWLPSRLSNFIGVRLRPGGERSAAPAKEEQTLAEIFDLREGIAPDILIDQAFDVPKTEAGKPWRWNASNEMVRVYRAVCQLLRPKIIIETGVANGASTLALLDWLSQQNEGHLYSIDLPPLGTKNLSYIGSVVPDRLKSRWTLIIGPESKELPKLLKKLGRVDLFIHDADHSYYAQRKGYRLALSYLAKGGVLISDDVNNSAFEEVAQEYDLKPFFLARRGDRGVYGLMRNRTV